MGRRFRILIIGISLLTVAGCAGVKDVTPAMRLQNRAFTYDCCDPGLDAGTKEMCMIAEKDADHILWDTDGNRYIHVWSDCKIGNEPWRKYVGN